MCRSVSDPLATAGSAGFTDGAERDFDVRVRNDIQRDMRRERELPCRKIKEYNADVAMDDVSDKALL